MGFTPLITSHHKTYPMRNLAVLSALLSCSAGLFLLTTWVLSPSLGDSLIVPFSGLVLLALVFPLFVGAAAIGRAEVLAKRIDTLDYQLRAVAAQIPPPGVHTGIHGMPQLNELVGPPASRAPIA